MRVAAIVPHRDGERWLPGCLAALRAQERPFDALIVVDDGSSAGPPSVAGDVRLVARPCSGGFAAAVNAGIAAAADCNAVALVNTDVELDPDWLARLLARLADPSVAAVACKLVRMDDAGVIDDAGDVLRRDGVCEQRGRGRLDGPRFSAPGEVFAACAGAALYRREAVLAAGGLDERYGMYLEDVDLGLRLRLRGATCAYEPALARHAGGGSGQVLSHPVTWYVARNTLLLVARWYPWRWSPLVLYRQLAWLAHAARERRLRAHAGGLSAALPHLRARRRERRADPAWPVPIESVVPARPVRGARAGGHGASSE